MKKKLIALLIFIMALSFTVVACNKATSESQPTSTVESTEESLVESQNKESVSTSVTEKESLSTSTSQTESNSTLESVKESESEKETQSQNEVKTIDVRLVIKDHTNKVVFDKNITADKGLRIEEWVIEKFGALDLIYGKIDVILFNGEVININEQINVDGTIEILLLNNEIVEVALVIKDSDGQIVYEDKLTGNSGYNVEHWLIYKFGVQEIIYGQIDTLSFNGELVNTGAEIYTNGTIEICLVYSETVNVRVVIENYDGYILFDSKATADKGLTVEKWIVDIFGVLDLIYGKVDTMQFNGEFINLSEEINVGGIIGIVLLNNEIVEINLTIRDCDDNVVYNKTLIGERGLNVENWLIDKFGVQDLIYGKIDTLAFNGELVNTSAEIYTNGTIEIKLNTTLDVAIVTYQLNFNGSDTVAMQVVLPIGTKIEDVLLAISEGDQSILYMVYDVVVDGESIDREWVLDGSCHMLVYLQLEMPPFGTCNVSLVGDDTDGNKMYDMHQQVEQGTSVYDALVNVFGLTQEDLDKIVNITINGESIDMYNTQIVEDCTIEVLINNIIGGGEIGYTAVTLIYVDENYNIEYYYFQMNSESVCLEDIVYDLFSRTVEEMSKIGRFFVDGMDYVDAKTIVYAGSTVKYEEIVVDQQQITVYYSGVSYEIHNGKTVREFLLDLGYIDLMMYSIYVNDVMADQWYVLCDGDTLQVVPIGDMGGFNVWFDVGGDGSLDGEDQFLVPAGSSLEGFVNSFLVYNWHYSFASYDEAVAEGYFTINGNEASRFEILSPEVIVSYVSTSMGECDHNFDEYGYCPDCGMTCPHDSYEVDVPCSICGFLYRRSINAQIYVLYAYVYEDGGYNYGLKSNSFYREVYSHDNVSIQSAIMECFGMDMSGADHEGVVRYWLRNGEVVTDEDLLENGDVLIGVPDVEYQPYSVKLEVQGGVSAEYTFSIPMPVSLIYEKYFADYGRLEMSDYNVVAFDGFGSSIYEDLIYRDITIEFRLRTVEVYFTLINENGVSGAERSSYRVDQKPTLKNFLAEKGIRESDYFIYMGSSLVDVESCGTDYYSVTAIKKSIVPSQFNVHLTRYDEYGYAVEYNLTFSEPIAMGMFWSGFWANEEEYVYFDFSREDIIWINGVRYDFYTTEDISYLFLYNDAEVVIKRGYYISLDVDYQMYEAVFEERVRGQEILSAFGLEIDLDEYMIQYDGYRIEKEMFLNDYYPYDGSRFAGFSFGKGEVVVEYYYVDLYDCPYQERIRTTNKVTFSDFISEEDFNDYIWKLYSYDGANEKGYYLGEVTDYSRVFEFSSNNCDYWGTTSYYLEGEAKQFLVMVYIDNEYKGEYAFNKADRLTFGEILATFGDYPYNKFDWMFYGNDGYADENTVITSRFEAHGTNNSPRFTLYVNTYTSYTIYHEEDMTLAEVLDDIYEEYGVTINYSDYIWDYGMQLDDIVANAGYWCEIAARTLSSVEVCYFTDGYPVCFEDGDNRRTYSRGDEFVTPTEFMTDMYYDIVVPTGRWIYRGTKMNPCEKVIKTVDDLFALQLENVELYAEFVVDYQRLYGTYVTDSDYVIVINENGLTYVNGRESFVELQNAIYEVFFTHRVWIESEGRFIDGMYLQEGYKVTDGEVIIFAGDTGLYYRFDDLESFNAMFDTDEYLRIAEIRNAEGEVVENISTGVYFVDLTY